VCLLSLASMLSIDPAFIACLASLCSCNAIYFILQKLYTTDYTILLTTLSQYIS
jgi:hypothetical protein